MTIEEQNHHATKVQTLLTALRPRTRARQAMNLLMEDVRRSPGETLVARRARINAARTARLYRDAETFRGELPMGPVRDDLIEHDSNGMA